MSRGRALRRRARRESSHGHVRRAALLVALGGGAPRGGRRGGRGRGGRGGGRSGRGEAPLLGAGARLAPRVAPALDDAGRDVVEVGVAGDVVDDERLVRRHAARCGRRALQRRQRRGGRARRGTVRPLLWGGNTS